MNKKLANVIRDKINKKAYSRSGHNLENITFEYNDVELVIYGQKRVCDISVEVEYSFDWYLTEDTYWEPGETTIRNIRYNVEDIGVDDNTGKIYTKEQLNDILWDNLKTLDELIEDDVDNAAHEATLQE